MATTIRLTRMGRSKRPFYRLVVADSRMPRDGRFLDMIGTYDPLQSTALIKIDEEKVLYWLSKGVTLSDTVRQILTKSGVIKKFNEMKHAS